MSGLCLKSIIIFVTLYSTNFSYSKNHIFRPGCSGYSHLDVKKINKAIKNLDEKKENIERTIQSYRRIIKGNSFFITKVEGLISELEAIDAERKRFVKGGLSLTAARKSLQCIFSSTKNRLEVLKKSAKERQQGKFIYEGDYRVGDYILSAYENRYIGIVQEILPKSHLKVHFRYRIDSSDLQAISSYEVLKEAHCRRHVSSELDFNSGLIVFVSEKRKSMKVAKLLADFGSHVLISYNLEKPETSVSLLDTNKVTVAREVSHPTYKKGQRVVVTSGFSNKKHTAQIMSVGAMYNRFYVLVSYELDNDCFETAVVPEDRFTIIP